MIDSSDKTLLWGGARIFQVWGKRLEVSTVYAVVWLISAVILWVPVRIILGIATTSSPSVTAVPYAIIAALVLTMVILFSAKYFSFWGLRSLVRQGSTTDQRLDRVQTVAESLCAQSGLELPDILVIDTGAVNATSVLGPRGHASILITRGALAQYSIIELEAVVAREIARLRSGLASYDAILSLPRKILAWVSFGAYPARLKPSLAREIEMVDLAALTLTRFPPALADALEKSLPPSDEEGVVTIGIGRAAAWQWLYPWVYREANASARLRVDELREW
ncbi:MAG: hypothetical protein ACP5PJ_08935 [Acidimicrobiales bacterium]